MKQHHADHVEMRKVSALWYAWGAFDTHKSWGLGTDEAQAFADEQEQAAAAYVNEERTSLPSLMDAFAAFVKARGVVDPFGN